VPPSSHLRRNVLLSVVGHELLGVGLDEPDLGQDLVGISNGGESGQPGEDDGENNDDSPSAVTGTASPLSMCRDGYKLA
jgi:hypothetical protein